jgi:hypothetical protein
MTGTGMLLKQDIFQSTAGSKRAGSAEEEPNLWETYNIPYINILMDHPFHYEKPLQNAPATSVVLCTDRNHVRYIRRYFKNIRYTDFLPHAGVELGSRHKPLAERGIDVLYAGYDALTEDERSKLSDTQIEKWEEKAKQGLLRRDSTLQTLLSDMRTMLNKGVQVTLADGSTKTMSLASIGIVTGDYTENGKLHILGDEDDENYASQENKLRAALEGNDNLVSQIIGGTTDNKGVGTQMYDYLRKSMTRIEGVRSTQTFYNDKTLDSEIDDYDDEIDKWEEKLQNLEDKYYNQFSKMEAAMAKMQSQQSYLSSLFGS